MAERPKRRGYQAQEIGRYDQALRGAKNAGKKVKVDLALEATFAEDATFEAHVLEVDRFSIKFDILVPVRRTVWVSKAFIVGTEVCE